MGTEVVAGSVDLFVVGFVEVKACVVSAVVLTAVGSLASVAAEVW